MNTQENMMDENEMEQKSLNKNDTPENPSKPSTGRILLAISFALFVARLPDLLMGVWKWIIPAFILVSFIAIPPIKGLKSGLIAAFFSMVFAGLGQLYLREYGRAFLFIISAMFAYMTTGYSAKAYVFNNILFIIAAIDAYSVGKRGIGII